MKNDFWDGYEESYLTMEYFRWTDLDFKWIFFSERSEVLKHILRIYFRNYKNNRVKINNII